MRYQSCLAVTLAAITAIAVSAPLRAADLMAGKAAAESVCAACHGANGISVADDFPNLAGQKEAYLAAQLMAYKSGGRKNAMMNAVAEQLSGDDVKNVAAFFASLPGGQSGTAKSKPLDHMISARMAFPADYAKTYTYYTTINFEKRKQVRKYFANPAATAAARAGQPLPDGSFLLVEIYKVKLGADKKPVVGSDGFYVPEKLAAYATMERRPGWGKEFPAILRNGDWNYAVFKADKTLKPGVNQATCLACHKPLAKDSYVFSLEALKKVAVK